MNDLHSNSFTTRDASDKGDQFSSLRAGHIASQCRSSRTASVRDRLGNPGLAIGSAAFDHGRIEHAVREILLAVGEDPDRDGLRDTPRRYAKALAELFSGMRDDAGRHLRTRFVQDSDEAVLIREIDFSSTCEHHLLPFFGKAHVAYLPAGGQVVGLSKLARTIDVYARRPQLQERLVRQIADALESHLKPRGVCVVLQAEHLCMRLRGACKPGAITTTTAFRGVYRTSRGARAEVISMLMGK